MTYTLIVPTEYPLVLLACLILTIECFLLGPVVVGPARFKAFNKEFMEQFKEEHQQAFGESSEPAVGGWPDGGDGRYSQKLSYKAWVEFNNCMRVHQNFVEQLPLWLTFLLVAGLFIPLITAILGFLLAGARLVYIILYIKLGPNARKLGAITGGLPLNLLALFTFGFMIYEAFKHGGDDTTTQATQTTA